MRKFISTFFMIMAIGISGVAITGCDTDGPAEEAGENFDEAVEDTKDSFDNDSDLENAAENAADETGEAFEEAGDEIEEGYDDATN